VIRELSAKPKPTNNKAKIAFYILLAVGCISTLCYMVLRALSVEKSGLVGFVPLIALCAAVFFYTKYVSPVYYYDVTFDSEGCAVFVVRQTVGKRQSTLCRIGLSEITSIKRESAEERRAHKTPKDHRKYSYVPTFMPEVTYRISTRSRYERSEILIECSDDFVSLLRDYAAEAREMQRIVDEEE
jgi:hypothetical protein